MSKVLIIAEAGVNHNGNIAIAKKLIDVAASAGADIIKFQTFKAHKLVSKIAPKATYQESITNAKETQFEMLKKLELSDRDHDELMCYCVKKNIEFLSTPFDEDSAALLQGKGVKVGKIPSGEITNLLYLRTMARTFPFIILSTGMADLHEIKEAIHVLLESGTKKKNITVLHCNTEYPTPMKDVNLLAMNHIARELNISVGYSDHTLGIEVPVAAVALGATIIEKHFTLDRNMEGPDHRASLEPLELKAMVNAIRNIEKAIGGSGVKTPSQSELKNRIIARKSIHARKDLPAGHIITMSDLIARRPGDGISPMIIDSIVGKKIVKLIVADQKLQQSHFE